MNWIAYLLILVAAFAVSMWVSRPFNHPQPAAGKPSKSDQAADKLESLEREHQRLLDALQELEVDHAQGKLDETDYAEQRGGLLQSGAAVLRQMDEGK